MNDILLRETWAGFPAGPLHRENLVGGQVRYRVGTAEVAADVLMGVRP